MDQFSISLQEGSPQNISLQGVSSNTISLAVPSSGTSNYERLRNKPSINGVILLGNKTSADLNIVSENTESGWNDMTTYVPKQGEICLYTDTHRIKIGDGSVCLVDLPYINSADIDTVMDALRRHIEDTSVHVTQKEKDFWNAKLNYDVSGEELTFTRN